VPLAWWFLEKTTWGLKGGGQNLPRPTAGRERDRVRYFCVMAGGVLAGGASPSIALTNLFRKTDAGRVIAVALVYFGGWCPWRAG
jgi:ABC-type uncharacterized transport system permease subunit